MLDTSGALILARLQFAFTISAHIIFPAISIGLANYCAVLEGLWLRTGKVVYRELFSSGRRSSQSVSAWVSFLVS
jgi:cytochrome bd ubiquinol oxidase subunit I